MHITLTRSRAAAAGAALLAVVALAGCGEDEAPTADAPSAPATSEAAPETSAEPTTPAEPTTEAPTSEAPATTEPAEEETTEAEDDPEETPSTSVPTASAAKGLTKPGTTLKFGQSANVKVDYAGSTWIGGIKVTALEKAPKSDYKELGVRSDAGNVYYLRYDVTYLAGKTKYPPDGGQVSWTDLHPKFGSNQKLQLINNPGFDKCTTVVHDNDEEELEQGETAKNMCHPFLVNKGKLTQVIHENYNDEKHEYEIITWKK